MVGLNWLTNQPSLSLLGRMFRVGERTRSPVSLHAALICSWVARVPERRKRSTGITVASLAVVVAEVAEAVTSDTTLETALRMAETTGATSVEVGTASVAVRLEMASARLSRTEVRAAVGSVTLPSVGKVPLRPVGNAAAASEEMQVDARTGTVSTVYVVMIISLVITENSVGLGQASVSGAVGPEGSVKLPVGKGGGVAVILPKPPVPVVSATLDERVNRPVRSPSLFVNAGPVEF